MANLEAYGTNIVGSGSGGGGGLTQEEHDWLESLASYTPNMYDINPNLVDSSGQPGAECYSTYVTSLSGHFMYDYYCKIPVCGYKRVKIWGNPASSAYSYIKYRFQFADNSFGTPSNAVSGWTDWITIPENAVGLQFSNNNERANITVCYALSTSES